MDRDLILALRDALDLAGRERDDFLATLAARDPGLAEQVRTQLANVRDIDAVDDDPISDCPVSADDRIGPFRPVRLLGTGGMGEVWLGERIDGFEQRVAIKWVSRPHLETACARFARERALLARLSHPHVASVIDGGEHAGRLWYAMEYIDGHPIDRFVRDRGLDIDATVTLFRQLCAAVQYAHQNLIVHRDLKPSNILVQHDGTVKLLDFGIAKLLDDTEALTETRAPMTLAYAAPEQVRGDPVSTATDLYALGVVLYELLVGHRPFDDQSTAFATMQRITDTDPELPSQSLVRHGTVDPARIRRLRGDLDTIVMKALSRDPVRRYASAAAMADDLKRFLEGLPIEARADTRFYRLSRLLLRHRRTAAVMSVATLVAMVALGVSLVSAQRETEALREASRLAQANERSRQFLVSLFAAANPERSLGNTVTAIDLLDAGFARLASESLDAATVAQTARSIGESYYALGDMEKAEVAFKLALEKMPPEARNERVDLVLRLAGVDAEHAAFDSARARIESVANLSVVTQSPSLRRRMFRLTGFIERDSDNARASIDALKQALAITPVPEAEAFGLWNSLAFSQALAGDTEDAVLSFANARKALGDLPDEHPAMIWLAYTEGDAHRRMGRFADARRLLRGALTHVQRGAGHGPEIVRVIAQALVLLDIAEGVSPDASTVTLARLGERDPAEDDVNDMEARMSHAAWRAATGAREAKDELAAIHAVCVKRFGSTHRACSP